MARDGYGTVAIADGPPATPGSTRLTAVVPLDAEGRLVLEESSIDNRPAKR